MHCPRCGHHNEPDDRFCRNCGASLKGTIPGEGQRARKSPRERASDLRKRILALIGTTRVQRLTTAGTIAAIAVAIAAFLALDADDDSDDDYTRAADEICLGAKQQIAAARPTAPGLSETTAFASEIVAAVAAWHSRLIDLPTPSDQVEEATALDEALLDSLVEYGALARAPSAAVPERAAEADAASGRVEEAVDELGLDGCAELEIA